MENKKLFGLICYLQRQMSRENNELFVNYGVTPIQMNTMVFIHIQSRKGERVCQKDIEKYLNLRPSSVSVMLGTLEKNGIVTRAYADGDARTKYVTLTEKGKYACIKNKLLMDKCDGVIQNALTEEEQETFKNLLHKIIAEIEKPEKGENK